MELGIIGTSIWQQNLPLLEELTIDRDSKESTLQELRNSLNLNSLVYLSTCNRVEFIYTLPDNSNHTEVLHKLVDYFFRGGRSISFFPNDFYQYNSRDAITHLFRMVSSLESLVVGETQITGQFKQACQEASELGLIDEFTEKVTAEALRVAAKVKRETQIGNGNLSMASLAAKELCLHLEPESHPVIALIGSGEMSRKLSRYISETLSAKLIFVNRTVENVREMSADAGGTSLSLIDFLDAPPVVHAIVSATASSDPVLDSTFAKRLAKHGNSVLCIDLAIPRDFSADFRSGDLISYVDIPVLKSRSEKNLRRKFVETSRANEIISESVQEFISNRIAVSLRPIFSASHQESLKMARRAFTDLFQKKVTNLNQDDQDAVLRLVTKLIGHTAYQPAKAISHHLVQTNDRINIGRLHELSEEQE